jgi:hypothetical protein
VPVELVSELLSDFQKLDIKQPVSLNYSQLDPTLLLLKEVLMLLLETCMRMTGDGIFMILLKEVIGLVIKMPFNT